MKIIFVIAIAVPLIVTYMVYRAAQNRVAEGVSVVRDNKVHMLIVDVETADYSDATNALAKAYGK